MAAIYGPRTPLKFNSMEIPCNVTAPRVDDHCAVNTDLITGTVSHHIKTTTLQKEGGESEPVVHPSSHLVCGGFIPAVL